MTYKEASDKLIEKANETVLESELQAKFAEWQVSRELDEKVKAQKQANADLLHSKAKNNREATELFKQFLSETPDLN